MGLGVFCSVQISAPSLNFMVHSSIRKGRFRLCWLLAASYKTHSYSLAATGLSCETSIIYLTCNAQSSVLVASYFL